MINLFLHFYCHTTCVLLGSKLPTAAHETSLPRLLLLMTNHSEIPYLHHSGAQLYGSTVVRKRSHNEMVAYQNHYPPIIELVHCLSLENCNEEKDKVNRIYLF